jgi:hypothetical protein
MDITPARLCLFLALVLFAIAAFWRPPTTSPFNMVAAGLALLALGLLLG